MGVQRHISVEQIVGAMVLLLSLRNDGLAQSLCPSANVSIYYVKESSVCPDGYPADERCPKITDIDAFLEELDADANSPPTPVPPQLFVLTEFHRNILIGYASLYKDGIRSFKDGKWQREDLPLELRYSSFFLFEWLSEPPASIKLTREHPRNDPRTVEWPDIEGRWVYHENAMYLDPDEETKWFLSFPGCATPYEIKTVVHAPAEAGPS